MNYKLSNKLLSYISISILFIVSCALLSKCEVATGQVPQQNKPQERNYSLVAPLTYWQYNMQTLDSINDAILFSDIPPATRRSLTSKIAQLQNQIIQSISYQQKLYDSLDNVAKHKIDTTKHK